MLNVYYGFKNNKFILQTEVWLLIFIFKIFNKTSNNYYNSYQYNMSVLAEAVHWHSFATGGRFRITRPSPLSHCIL